MNTYDNAEDVLRYCLDNPEAALVVLSSVTGGTLRAAGAMMAVTPTSYVGYISNGCVDADIVSRARTGQSGQFTYGEGSPYRDISLPCGGRLDICIDHAFDRAAVKAAVTDLANRKETVLKFGVQQIPLRPRLKLRIAGRGAVSVALAAIAENCGFDVHVQSPDPDLLQGAEHLIDLNDPPNVTDDNRTAMVCLFHDHDWEAALLRQAMSGPCFYIGAMGSQVTHKNRCESLLKMGFKQTEIDQIKAPIGLVPAQRDSRLLAISVLAEIVQTAQSKNLI